MYAELSFLERIAFLRDTEVFGKLWVGHIAAEGERQFLKITSCPVPPCICNSECHYYKVKSNGQLEPVTKLGFRVDIVNLPLNKDNFVAIYSSWQNGLPKANVDIDYYNGSSTIATQSFVGMVADTGLFTSNGINYLVVMLQYMKGELNETDTKERTIIFVLKLDSAGKKVAKTWSRELRLKAISVNGHSLDYITWEFLLDGVDQNVQESWRANYMEVDVFTTLGSPIAGTISGVLTSGRFSAT
ncbi:uncharacterized protein [Panulirus ornatus]|uniref:uncharacterized protein isoform X1 n=1 Tax=Panulirus ornatus TaxID=150431 RepID=UPI003A84124D